MKKFIILICCLVLVLGTVACTPNDTLIDDSNQQQQQEQDTEFDPLEQVNDPYAQVDVGEGTGIGSLEGEKWDTLQDGAKPLEVGESYTERWSTEPYAMRLRPYEVQFGKDEPAGASFEFLKNGNGNSVVIETDGERGGAFDYVEFSGMRYVEDALYKFDIEYTVMTVNRTFKVGFDHNYFLDLSGTKTGESKKTTGIFTATTANGYNNNLNSSIIVMVAGGESPAQIRIDSMTVTRLPDAPKVSGLHIAGNYVAGGKLTAEYEIRLPDGYTETGTQIDWFVCSDDSGANKTILSALRGRKEITVTQDMEHYYIGVQVIPRCDAPGVSAEGKAVSTVGECVGAPLESIGDYWFRQPGDSFTETFESLNEPYKVWIRADEGVTTYISDENAISGKSLFVSTENEIKGGYFTGMRFTGGGAYTISFSLKFVTVPSEMYVQFRALSSLGYTGDVKYQIPTSSAQAGTVYDIEIPALRIQNVNDYELQVFAVGASGYYIDDLTVRYVNVSDEIYGLKEKGGSMTEDFDTKNILTSIDTFGWDGIALTKDGITGRGLRFSAKESGSITAYFLDFINNLAAGETYRVTFKYYYLNAAPQDFYVGFRNMAGNQNNTKLDFTGKKAGEVYTFEQEFKLADEDDMFLQMFNMAADGSVLVIDDLTILFV